MANTQRYTELINKYLDQTAIVLINYLNNILPRISNNWWERTVIEKFKDEQIEIKTIKRNNIVSLDGLDLATLLKIFDLNWNEISQIDNFLKNDRNILKETQTVRNDWAHKPNSGYSLDDIYRDFDTIQRFLGLINASQEIIEELQRIKRDIRQEMDNEPSNKVTKNVNKVNTKVKDKGSNWSGYYFVNTGISDDPVRNWEYNIKYNFISAGNDLRYISRIQTLRKGDKIFAYTPKKGYVGYGIVEEKAVLVKDFFIDKKNNIRMIDNFPDGHKWKQRKEPNTDEWIVKVVWKTTFKEDDAIPNKDNPFSYRNNVCKLKSETLNYLGTKFGINPEH